MYRGDRSSRFFSVFLGIAVGVFVLPQAEAQQAPPPIPQPGQQPPSATPSPTPGQWPQSFPSNIPPVPVPGQMPQVPGVAGSTPPTSSWPGVRQSQPQAQPYGQGQDWRERFKQSSPSSTTAPPASTSQSSQQSAAVGSGCLGLTAQQEVEIGKKARNSLGFPVATDGNAQARMTRVFRRLVGASATPGTSYGEWGKYGGWDLAIVDMGEKGPNALAFPGGIVAFDRRLADLPDEQVAFILAHEISHSILCHPFLGEEFRKGDLNVKRIVDNVWGVGIAPALEKMADERGIWLMRNAGFDPEKGIKWLEEQARKEPKFLKWVNRHVIGTHPSPDERLKAARERIEGLKPKVETSGSRSQAAQSAQQVSPTASQPTLQSQPEPSIGKPAQPTWPKVREKLEEFVPALKQSPPPVLSSIVPSSGAPGIRVRIQGKDLNPPGAMIQSRVIFESAGRRMNAEVVPPLSETQIEAVVPPGSGAVDVHVETVSGSSSKLKFNYLKPRITEVRPASGERGREVELVGENFGIKGQDFSVFSVGFGESLPQAISWDDRRIVVKAPMDFGTGTNLKIVFGSLGCIVDQFGGLSKAAEFLVDLAIPGCPDLIENIWKRYRLRVRPGFMEREVKVSVKTSAGTSNERSYTYQVRAEIRSRPSQPQIAQGGQPTAPGATSAGPPTNVPPAGSISSGPMGIAPSGPAPTASRVPSQAPPSQTPPGLQAQPAQPQSGPPAPDPQLLAQVQQVRTAWQQLNAQVNQLPNLQPADRTTLSQDLQRGSQALDAAEAAAQRGDRATMNVHLNQTQQALDAARQRLTQIASRPTPTTPPPPSAAHPQPVLPPQRVAPTTPQPMPQPPLIQTQPGKPAQPMPPQIPTPTADPQLVAQVQQVRNAWQQLNAQVSQTPNLQPEDRAALAQDMQRGSQALDAAEAAAKHGDRGTTQKQLGQVQQALASASQRLSEIARRPAPAPQQPPRAGPASPPPAPAPSPTPDPQLFAQVQQLRTAWQQINTQVTQMPNLQPQDRASLIQDLQRGSQAIDGAEAAARRGDRATVQAQLAHAQQVLGAVSQRLSQIVQRAAAPQQTPRASPPSAPPPQATLSPPGPFSLSATTRCSAAQPEVVLSWNASPGAKAYALLRNGQLYRDFTYVGTSLAFVNQGVVGGTRYTYVVRAKNDAGQTRDSNPVTAAPPTCRR